MNGTLLCLRVVLKSVVSLNEVYFQLLNQSGNQDLCYFNFLCAHPLLVLSDFNHVYSNLGYVLLGALFLLQVWRRHQQHRADTAREVLTNHCMSRLLYNMTRPTVYMPRPLYNKTRPTV